MYHSATRNIFCVLIIGVHQPGAFILRCYSGNGRIIISLLHLPQLLTGAFIKIGRIKPLYEVVEKPLVSKRKANIVPIELQTNFRSMYDLCYRLRTFFRHTCFDALLSTCLKSVTSLPCCTAL